MLVLMVFGTRPEAIKMAPLFRVLRASTKVSVELCVTGQHREMLDQILDFFSIRPDYDLNLMIPGQSLNQLLGKVISHVGDLIEQTNPDLVLVHGDTTTAVGAAIAAFQTGTRIGHVEAGLRTHDIKTPFPEEFNRSTIGRMTDLHFAPTDRSAANLVAEGVPIHNIHITGNTVIDALISAAEMSSDLLPISIEPTQRLVLITSHRRENFGSGVLQICDAVAELAKAYPDVVFYFPVHLNPKILVPATELLRDIENVWLAKPCGYGEFVALLNRCYLVLTDSGGIQEEAPSIGKPVLVMRESTERPEAVEAGTVLLVGSSTEKIVENAVRLLEDQVLYQQMSEAENPFGDGTASTKILTVLEELNESS